MLFLAPLFFSAASVGMAQQSQTKASKAVADGKLVFGEYCADCHGPDAKGNGLVVPALKQQPPDLTTLSKRNNGTFPTDNVKKVLAHGVTLPVHGTAEMPIWGKTFVAFQANELIQYLQSVQVK
jgi:mono/diheme cytochrome c family protein